jgi:hypothetical protein
MGSLQTSSDAKLKNVGSSGILYFLGKVVGKEPSIDLAAKLKPQEASLLGQSIEPLLKRCIAELNTRGTQLRTAAEVLAKPANQSGPAGR